GAFPARDSWFWLLHSRRRRRNLAALRDRNTTTAPPAIRPTMSVHRDSSSELPNHATATTQGVRPSTAVSHSRLAGKDVKPDSSTTMSTLSAKNNTAHTLSELTP